MVPSKVAIAAENGIVGPVESWLDGGGRIDTSFQNKGQVSAGGNAHQEQRFEIAIKNITLLMVSARNGHQQLVELLLKRGAEVNLSDSLGATALIGAAANGHEQVIDSLIQHGAAINQQGENGSPALHAAAFGGHERVVDLLLRRGAEIDQRNYGGWTAMMCAANFDQPAVLLRLLRAGADMTIRDLSGISALQLAKEKSHTACVDAFRKHLEELRARRDAAAGEASAAAALLGGMASVGGDSSAPWASNRQGAGPPSLEVGSRVWAKDGKWRKGTVLAARASGAGASGMTAAAAGSSTSEPAPAGGEGDSPKRPLVAAPATPDGLRAIAAAMTEPGRPRWPAPPPSATQPAGIEIMGAVERGDEAAVLAWIEAGGTIETTWTIGPVSDGSVSGLTLLMSAARYGRDRVADLLLRHGAGVDHLPPAFDMIGIAGGATALVIAARLGHVPVIDVLLLHGAEVDRQDSYGASALSNAAHYNFPAVVRQMLRAGADTRLRDNAGDTALQVAKARGHTECAHAIEEHLTTEKAAEKAARAAELAEVTAVREAERAAAEVEAARHATALLAEIEAEEAAEKHGKGKKGKKKKKKKGKGGGSGGAGPSQEPKEAAEAAAEAAEAAAALAAAEEAELAAALEESARLEDEARRGAGGTSGSALQDAAQCPEPAAGSEVPPELQCPLSFEIMSDPVMNVAGQTYERVAIEKWFAMGNRTDPMSGVVLESMLLVPNVALRSMCRKYQPEA